MTKKIILGVVLFIVVATVILSYFCFSERGQKTWESFFPTAAEQGPKVDVTRITYHDDTQTLVVYFSNRPRIDYHNFPKEDYLTFREAENLSEYYRKNVSGKFKPY